MKRRVEELETLNVLEESFDNNDLSVFIDKNIHNYVAQMNYKARKISKTFPSIKNIELLCGEGSYYFLKLVCEGDESFGFTYNYDYSYEDGYDGEDGIHYEINPSIQRIGAICFKIVTDYIYKNNQDYENYELYFIPHTGTFMFQTSGGFYSDIREYNGSIYQIDNFAQNP